MKFGRFAHDKQQHVILKYFLWAAIPFKRETWDTHGFIYLGSWEVVNRHVLEVEPPAPGPLHRRLEIFNTQRSNRVNNNTINLNSRRRASRKKLSIFRLEHRTTPADHVRPFPKEGHPDRRLRRWRAFAVVSKASLEDALWRSWRPASGGWGVIWVGCWRLRGRRLGVVAWWVCRAVGRLVGGGWAFGQSWWAFAVAGVVQQALWHMKCWNSIFEERKKHKLHGTDEYIIIYY